ncbi:MAG: hypothetical protein ACD_51C00094G0001, partial [uncultured bacterium]
SFLAAKLGARECHLYESETPMLLLSKKIAKDSGVKGCSFYETYSTEMMNPVKTDIVVSETLGNFAYEEHIIEVMNDAKRFLKKGGVVIPQKLTYFVAPVLSARVFDEINVWNEVGYGVNFSKIKEVACSSMYVKTVKGDEVMGDGVVWDEVDFRVKNKSVRSGSGSFKIAKDAKIYGFVLWWDCELVPGVKISTSPFAKATHWEQIFLPLKKPIVAKKGETVSVEIKSDTRYSVGVDVRWGVRK